MAVPAFLDPVRADWLNARRAYLGGTDIAAIVGMNPYKTRLSVYLSKRGEMEDTSGVKAEMGTYLEPLVKAMFARESGLTAHAAPEHLRHPEYDFLGGNPDGVVSVPEGIDGEEGLLECKTYDYNTADEWGEKGTDQIPRAYFVQCTWYMGLTCETVCYVAALHRTTGDFGIWVVRFDPELYALLVEAGVKFQREHIECGLEPAPSGGDIEYLRKIYPTDTGGVMIADPEMEEWAERMRDLKRQIKPLESEFDDLKARFIAQMKDDSLCETMLGSFTYRQAKDSVSINWEAAYWELWEMPHVGAYVSRIEAEEIVATNSKRKPGSRRFLTPFSKESK